MPSCSRSIYESVERWVISLRIERGLREQLKKSWCVARSLERALTCILTILKQHPHRDVEVVAS